MRRKFRPVIVAVHPDFYSKLESMQKEYKEINGLRMTLTQATGMIAKNIQNLKVPKIDILGGGRCLRKKQIQQI